MAAKNTRKPGSSRTPDEPRTPDIQDIFKLHLQASEHHDALVEEARALKAAGKIRESRHVQSQADDVLKQLTELRQELRLRGHAE